MELDKDLVCKDSNMYSPETYLLITNYMNTMFEERGIKCSIAESNGMYKVSFSILGKMIDVGLEGVRRGVMEMVRGNF